MNERINLVGKRFDRWTVIAYAGDRYWECRCDCGTTKNVYGGSLRRRRSLGCIKCHPAIGNRETHGQSGTRLYRVWEAMRHRCYNPKCSAYDRYGGRGISVCPQWKESFEVFYYWAIANGYADHLTIDRYPDKDGNYEPGNCRWATYAQQTRNYSRNRFVTHNGQQVLLCDLAAAAGLPIGIVNHRVLKYGWPIEEALTTPIMKKGQRRCTQLPKTTSRTSMSS